MACRTDRRPPNIVPSLARGKVSTRSAWTRRGNETSLVFPVYYPGRRCILRKSRTSAARFLPATGSIRYFLTRAQYDDPAIQSTAAYQNPSSGKSSTARYVAGHTGIQEIRRAAPADTLWDGTVKLTFVAIASTGPSAPDSGAVYRTRTALARRSSPWQPVEAGGRFVRYAVS